MQLTETLEIMGSILWQVGKAQQNLYRDNATNIGCLRCVVKESHQPHLSNLELN